LPAIIIIIEQSKCVVEKVAILGVLLLNLEGMPLALLHSGIVFIFFELKFNVKQILKESFYYC